MYRYYVNLIKTIFNLSVESDELKNDPVPQIKEEFLSDYDDACDSDEPSIESHNKSFTNDSRVQINRKKQLSNCQIPIEKSDDISDNQINQKDDPSIFKYELPLEEKMLCDDDIVHNPSTSIESNSIESNPLVQEQKPKRVFHLQLGEDNDEPYPFELNKLCVTCELCNKTFKFHSQLVLHMGIHYPNYVCGICEKPFALKKSLFAHLKIHDDLIPCCVCGKNIQQYKMFQHMKFHSDSLSQQCAICSEEFATYTLRLEHMKTVHDSEKNCEICHQNFTSWDNLKTHVEECHLAKLNFACDVCDKKFFYKNQLSEHMLEHQKIHKCDICHKKYKNYRCYKKHIVVHLFKKKFDCSICNKTFFTKICLNRHMITHYGVQL